MISIRSIVTAIPARALDLAKGVASQVHERLPGGESSAPAVTNHPPAQGPAVPVPGVAAASTGQEAPAPGARPTPKPKAAPIPKAAPKHKSAPKAKAAPKPKAAATPKAAANPKAAGKPKVAAKPKPAAQPKAVPKPKPAPQPKAAPKPKPAAKSKPKPAAKAKAASSSKAKPKEPGPHHVLNNPVGDPDPTEWPDPFDKREDPLGPGNTPAPGAISTSEPAASEELEPDDARRKLKHEKLDQ